MAVMTSCVREEDTYIDAVKLNAQGQPVGSGTTTPVSTTAVSSTPVSSTSAVDVSTIKNPLLTLNLATETALTKVGGYIQRSNITVARVGANSFAAVSQTCSHEPKKSVMYNVSEFYCPQHGARFNLNGTAKNSIAGRGITAYKTLSDGKTLVVYS